MRDLILQLSKVRFIQQSLLTLIMLGMFGMMSLLEYVRSMVVIRIGSQLDMRLNTRIYTAAYEANLKTARPMPARC